MKIAYCTPSLYLAGGVERVLTTKVNYLADVAGHDVTVVLTDGAGRQPYYPLSPRVSVVNLDIGFERMWNQPLWRRAAIYVRGMWRYRRALRRTLLSLRADIVVTTMRREVNFICDINDGSCKVGELHVTRSHYRNFESNESGPMRRFIQRIWSQQLLRKVRKLDAMVVLTPDEMRAWPELTNVAYIPNPLPFAPATLSELTRRTPSLSAIAVGRYSYQKGFDLLLQAWAEVHRRYPQWHLDIYGDGDREPYQRQAEALGLDAQALTLHPSDADIRSRYCEHDFYILSSRFEGFGMVIIEAMACGLPVVAFDCPTGPRELIADGVTGRLVPSDDIAALADAVAHAICDEAWRRQAATAAIEASRRFTVDNIMGEWLALFGQLTQKKPHR